MDSSVKSIYKILNDAESISSNGFSNGYNFDESSASEYFNELIGNSELPVPIFSGILILEKTDNKFTVIDGIQRITTIGLLLSALCESYKGSSKQNQDAKDKIFSRYLTFNHKPRLKLTGKDQTIYRKILFSEGLTEQEKTSNLYRTYQCFINEIKSHKCSGNKLFKILSKIQFMTVLTDKTEISARELYQALNSGKTESQINLISDFIEQEDHEASMLLRGRANEFKESEYLFESFLKDFLNTRLDKETLHERKLYNNFKNYYYKISKYQDTKSIVKEVLKYSNYYLKIINADFESQEIKEQLEILNKNGGNDTYPYLMQVIDDLENGHIDLEALLNILMMINLFIQSRKEISISNINIDFASLSKELNKMLILKDYVPNFVLENKLTINELNNLSNFGV